MAWHLARILSGVRGVPRPRVPRAESEGVPVAGMLVRSALPAGVLGSLSPEVGAATGDLTAGLLGWQQPSGYCSSS